MTTELEKILTRAHAAGAREAGYVTLRLPLELRDLFREWLAVHFPDKCKHTLSLAQSLHGGKDYHSQWGRRMAGSGPYAWMIGRRFEIADRASWAFDEKPSFAEQRSFQAAASCSRRTAAVVLF